MIIKDTPLKDPDRRIYINIDEYGLWTNCGARVVGNCGVKKIEFTGDTSKLKKNAYGQPIGSSINYVSVNECYEVLDKHRDELVLLGEKGFAVISDRINDKKRANRLEERAEMYTPNVFTTTDFVRYLVSRKIGTVIRGPIVMNRNYPDRSAITCWLWYNQPDLVIDDEVKVFSVPNRKDSFKKRNPNLYPGVQKFLQDERVWNQ